MNLILKNHIMSLRPLSHLLRIHHLTIIPEEAVAKFVVQVRLVVTVALAAVILAIVHRVVLAMPGSMHLLLISIPNQIH